MPLQNVDEWARRYARAWETRDADVLDELFTEDASYRAHPFRETHVGIAAIRDYWRVATRTQRQAEVRMGQPVVDGDRVAIEWWATLLDDDVEMTLPGCLLLRFAADGRCSELREYWHLEGGYSEPFDGWGH